MYDDSRVVDTDEEELESEIEIPPLNLQRLISGM